MKMLSALFVMLFAMSAMASSETKTFFYDGSEDAAQMTLQAEQTHTEYRYEQRWTTCYRQETHYEMRCYGNPPRCQHVPVTRTIPYSCMQTVSIPYQVKDFDVDADISLSFTKPETELSLAETIKVTLWGDKVYLASTGTKNYFVLAKETSRETQVNGTMKYIDASYAFSFVPAAPILKSIEMTNISMKNNVLSFSIGEVEVPEYIGFSLLVKDDPILGTSRELFNRTLKASEVTVNGKVASVNIKDLGVQLTSGRYTLTAKIFVKHPGQLVNKDEFKATEASRTLIYKIR